MLSDTGQSESLWMGTRPPEVMPPLSGNQNADACVTGAGIAGITTAYLLARQGKRVLVLEDGAVGGGETGQNTQSRSNALDDRCRLVEGLQGAAGARLAAASHSAAIDRIES